MTHVRPATLADRPALRAIQAASLDSPQPSLLDAGLRGAATVLVAGREPTGYALAVGRRPTDLVELAVAPDHRNAGRGSALLESLLARGGAFRLTVRADDERARRFYERHGFRLEKSLPGYYDDGDGLRLVRQPDSASDDAAES
ncbi:GNAT family N-acetyltransferase [Halococcus hamelinensis]|uniref:Pab N-terminal acetyltransferase n=2 Tax=Halococcus hamelinensis TaxID=332168 RepID=M0LRV6_9EURY|nr:N-acetyltransferase [Halococcus hamelinensis]EMA36211.1 Pab N-terminal acetyltransferase [Halococcus hamelinensis 100A6]